MCKCSSCRYESAIKKQIKRKERYSKKHSIKDGLDPYSTYKANFHMHKDVMKWYK